MPESAGSYAKSSDLLKKNDFRDAVFSAKPRKKIRIIHSDIKYLFTLTYEPTVSGIIPLSDTGKRTRPAQIVPPRSRTRFWAHRCGLRWQRARDLLMPNVKSPSCCSGSWTICAGCCPRPMPGRAVGGRGDRLAEEYDAAEERGEVAKSGQRNDLGFNI